MTNGNKRHALTETYPPAPQCSPQVPLLQDWIFDDQPKAGHMNNDIIFNYKGTAVAQWLRCCATNQKVAGSIPGCVSGFFIDIKSFRSHYGPGVDSASNRNEYQEYFLGVKAARA